MKTTHILLFSLIFFQTLVNAESDSYVPPEYFDELPRDNADYYYEIGMDYLVEGKYNQALAAFYQSYEKGVAEEGKDGLYNSETLMQIGYIEAKLLKYQKAEDSLMEAIRISVLHLGREAESNAQLYNVLGWIKSEQGDLQEAFKAYKQAFELQDCKNKENQHVCGTIYLNLASTYFQADYFEEAHDYNLKALNIFLALYGDTDVHVAKAYLELGVASQYVKKTDQALKCFEEAERILTTIFSQQLHPDLGHLYNVYAQVFCAVQDFEKCQLYLEKALSINVKFYGEDDLNIALLYANLANTYHSREKYDDALKFYTLAENMYMKHPEAADDQNVATLYKNLGYFFFDTQAYDKALLAYNKSMTIYIKAKGERYMPVGFLKFNTGLALMRLKKHKEALPILEGALGVYKEFLKEDDPQTAQVIEAIADVKFELAEYQLCLEYLEEALKLFRKSYEEDHYIIGKMIYKTGLAHYHLNHVQQGIELMEKAGEIIVKIDKKAAIDIKETVSRLKGEKPTKIVGEL